MLNLVDLLDHSQQKIYDQMIVKVVQGNPYLKSNLIVDVMELDYLVLVVEPLSSLVNLLH